MDRFRWLNVGVQAWALRQFGLPDIVYMVVELGLTHLEPHSDRIGLCVDTGHYLRLPLDPVDVVRAFRDRVHAIHLRDMDPDKDPIKGDGGNYMEHIVGEGPLELDGLMRLLLECKFPGTIALEYKPNAHNPMPDLRRPLRNIEEALREGQCDLPGKTERHVVVVPGKP